MIRTCESHQDALCLGLRLAVKPEAWLLYVALTWLSQSRRGTAHVPVNQFPLSQVPEGVSLIREIEWSPRGGRALKRLYSFSLAIQVGEPLLMPASQAHLFPSETPQANTVLVLPSSQWGKGEGQQANLIGWLYSQHWFRG